MKQLMLLVGGIFLLPAYIFALLMIVLFMALATVVGVASGRIYIALRGVNGWLGDKLHRVYAFTQNYFEEMGR